MAIKRGLFSLGSSASHLSPIMFRINPSSPLIIASSVCSAVHPGLDCRRPSANSWILSATSSYLTWVTFRLNSEISAEGVTSSIPIVMPLFISHRAASRATRPMASAAAAGEASLIITKNNPGLDPPRTFFPKLPHSNSLLENKTYPSDPQNESSFRVFWEPEKFFSRISRLTKTRQLRFGRSRVENTCLPVHSSIGFRMAGGGMSICSVPRVQ